MRNATHEKHDGSSVEESACGIDGGLEVLCQAPVAPDPGEEPLDDPAPWLDGKADLIRVLAHDLNRDEGSLGDLLSRISAVSEDPLDEWEDSARGAQERSAAIAILDARRMREIRTSGLMSGEGKRDCANGSRTAPLLDSTDQRA